MRPTQRITQLEGAIEALKKEYVDCATCPRNCCHFHEHFVLHLPEATAERAFGLPIIKQLLREKRLRREGEGTYELCEGTCPLLKDNLCTVHERKIDLGLQRCMDFPIYRIGPNKILIDKRCYYVDARWDALLTRCEELRRELDMHADVKYRDAASEVVRATLF